MLGALLPYRAASADHHRALLSLVALVSLLTFRTEEEVGRVTATGRMLLPLPRTFRHDGAACPAPLGTTRHFSIDPLSGVRRLNQRGGCLETVQILRRVRDLREIPRAIGAATPTVYRSGQLCTGTSAAMFAR